MMRDEGLEDVTANRVFFHVSEIGTVCDEINVHVVRIPEIAPMVVVYGSQIFVEELLKNPSTEAVSKSGAVWGKDGIRLRIADQTKSQVGGWVDGITVQRICRSVVVDRIEDQVAVGDLGISLYDPGPEAKEGERFFIVLV